MEFKVNFICSPEAEQTISFRVIRSINGGTASEVFTDSNIGSNMGASIRNVYNGTFIDDLYETSVNNGDTVSYQLQYKRNCPNGAISSNFGIVDGGNYIYLQELYVPPIPPNVNNLSFTTFSDSTSLSSFESIIYFNNYYIAFTRNGNIKYGSSISNINTNTKTIRNSTNYSGVLTIFEFNNTIYAAYAVGSNESVDYTIYSSDGINWSTINYNINDTTLDNSRWGSYIIDNDNAYFTHHTDNLLNVSNSIISTHNLIGIMSSIYVATLDIYIFYSNNGSLYYGQNYNSLTQSLTNLDSGLILDFAYGVINNSTVIVGVGSSAGNGTANGTRVRYSYDGYTFYEDAVGVNKDNKFDKVIFIEEMKVFIASSHGIHGASEGGGNGDSNKNMIYSYDGIIWNTVTIGYLQNIYWHRDNNIGYILGINSNGDIFKSQDFNFST